VGDTETRPLETERTGERGYALNGASWWRADVCPIGATILNPADRPIACHHPRREGFQSLNPQRPNWICASSPTGAMLITHMLGEAAARGSRACASCRTNPPSGAPADRHGAATPTQDHLDTRHRVPH